VDFTGLDANETVFNHVQAANALCTCTPVQLFDSLQHSDLLAIDGYWLALFEGDNNLIWSIAQTWLLGVCVSILGRRVPQIFQVASFYIAALYALVHGMSRRSRRVDR